mmetsp:Transcript_9430/g.18256  ORF Transcript_9430/g.18256 Transcript_9430/m.18256 type:complete len:148 (-) Transcript_9430:827-1270(-)
MAPMEGHFDAVIRTYEHRLVKVTVFASHRSPSYTSNYPAGPPTAREELAEGLASPPQSPTRLNRTSAPVMGRPPPIFGGHPPSATRTPSAQMAGIESDDGGEWSTHVPLNTRRHRASLIAYSPDATSKPSPSGPDEEPPVPKRRRGN